MSARRIKAIPRDGERPEPKNPKKKCECGAIKRRRLKLCASCAGIEYESE
jgi:hypothetical protein